MKTAADPWWMLALTCGLGGLQVLWTMMQSSGTSFLLSLGLPAPLTAFAWVSAPLAGTFVYPWMGSLSDRCKSRYGRRRPFILLGAVGAVLLLASLAWVETVTRAVCLPLGVDEPMLQRVILVTALVLIWLLNFAIQPLQMGLRALSVDVCPGAEQARANAWATNCIGVGRILGYVSAYSVRLGPTPAEQFQAMALIAILCLCATVAYCCAVIEESHHTPQATSTRLAMSPKRWLSVYRALPSGFRLLCQAQVCAWTAWFSFLYYSTIYIETLNKMSFQSSGNVIVSMQQGVVFGLAFAIVALGASLTLHSLMNRSKSKHEQALARYGIWKLLAGSHVIFGCILLATILVDQWISSAVILCLCGIPWSLLLWAPYTIIGSEFAGFNGDPEGCAERIEARNLDIGVVLSVHNICISLPQVFAAVLDGGII
ncbi:MFS general substrate transporter [Aspergillus fijiensis CBS 313.89]|uniref:MFS general substrate transporter n=1 Tax=Aspergillus fijiensis CBS 313.89 TaxID=1448319 RepID=A0A8G1W0U3_9EURO|nr:MFS general substrate transporter [Aspergillus fijiensis CBS 313.89]RAK80250.1 MFS general substrate transporter [Aspergillus fijiensis CBS 313.89]